MVQEQHLVGDTFLIGGKMSKMAPPIFTGTVTTAETVSPELFEIGSWQTPQNVQNGHILGGQ